MLPWDGVSHGVLYKDHGELFKVVSYSSNVDELGEQPCKVHASCETVTEAEIVRTR